MAVRVIISSACLVSIFATAPGAGSEDPAYTSQPAHTSHPAYASSPSSTMPPQVGTRPAKEWIPALENPERLAALKIPDVVQALEVRPGDIVADLGAGTGPFAWPLAKAVAPGTVYAVEVDKDFVTLLQQKVKETNVTNVHPILGKFEDPLLPEKIDLGFFSDVLHHVANRAAYLKTVAGYLKPGGRIAVIELDAAHPRSPHRDQPDLQVTRAQLDEWMVAAGLTKVREVPLFDDKWFVIYRKR